jgi:hypothetical protein
LVGWDPSALIQTDVHGYLPLHNVVNSTSIQGFQLVSEYGIRYFPKKKGISLIFKLNNRDGHIPFQYACRKFGREKVMKVVEETIIRCYSSSSDNTPPLNIAEALMTAAIDENVHFDCFDETIIG